MATPDLIQIKSFFYVLLLKFIILLNSLNEIVLQ